MAESFSTEHSSEIEPKSPDPLHPVLTTRSTTRLSHWFTSIIGEKRYMSHRISPPATDFFPYRTVVLGVFKLNIKARQEIREFLNANF